MFFFFSPLGRAGDEVVPALCPSSPTSWSSALPLLLVETLAMIRVKEFPQASIARERSLLNPAFSLKYCNLGKGAWPRQWYTRKTDQSPLLVSYFISRACLEMYVVFSSCFQVPLPLLRSFVPRPPPHFIPGEAKRGEVLIIAHRPASP